VNDFKARLRAGDLDLTREMEHAHSIVMRESVRNIMISTFNALDIFPPAEQATHVDNGDCNYEDKSAPLPLIAQRLYNDQACREYDAIGEDSCVQRQANTAAFLVDFAGESDVRLPPMPQMQDLLRDFAQRTDEFTQAIADQSHHKLETLLDGMGAGTAGYLLQQEVQQWWTEQQTPGTDQPEHKIEAFIEDLGVGSVRQLLKQGGQELSRLGQAVAWTAVGAIAAGAAAVVTRSLSQRGGEHHSQRVIPRGIVIEPALACALVPSPAPPFMLAPTQIKALLLAGADFVWSQTPALLISPASQPSGFLTCCSRLHSSRNQASLQQATGLTN